MLTHGVKQNYVRLLAAFTAEPKDQKIAKQAIYLSIYLSVYLSIYLPTYLCILYICTYKYCMKVVKNK